MRKIIFALMLFSFSSCYKESFVLIEGDFSTSFVNNDESVPVIVKIKNAIVGAETFQWEFEGADPATSSLQDPGEILYSSPGTYSIKLTATNSDGERKVIEKQIDIKDAIIGAFSYQIIDNNFSPVEVQINNTTQGQGLTYSWTFQGGSPAAYAGQNPPNVIFTAPGDHTVTLSISNGFETTSLTATVTVAPYLESLFSWDVSLEDQDYQVPVTVNFANQSISATQYQWTIQGGSPSVSTLQNPSSVFSVPGTYTVSLTALNSKTSQTISHTITVLPNTNLQVFEDVKFGINSAHHNNSFGAFFSTANQEAYTANQITNQNSSAVDIAFQGLNSNFTSNKFISPDKVTDYGFLALANAQQTIFINSQNICNCGLNFTVVQFDAMTDDSPLQPLNIPNSLAGAQEFGNVFPRIVLFKTQDGRKGAIKVKGKVQNGTSSYLICDIKVQKQ
jgi:PKD repeat protein